jgi:MoxR-like ATPase
LLPVPEPKLAATVPATVDATLALLEQQSYVAERRLATAVFLALKLRRPLFLEGEAGVGKTEIAKVLAGGLGRPLVRLQCYEGLDTAAAVYEWNYPRQMIEIRLAEAAGGVERPSSRTTSSPHASCCAGRCCRRSHPTKADRRCC